MCLCGSSFTYLLIYSYSHLLIYPSTHLLHKPTAYLFDIYYTVGKIYSQVNFQKKGKYKRLAGPPPASLFWCVAKKSAFTALWHYCSVVDADVVNQAGEVEGEVQTVGDTEVQTASTTVFVVSVLVAFLTYHD